VSVRRAVAPLVILIAWSALGSVDHRAVAGPLATARAIARGLDDGSLIVDLRATLTRAVLAIAVGLVAGVITGLALAALGRIGTAIEPSLDFLRAIPPLLLLPLFLLAFGYDDTARVLTAAWAVALVVALHAAAGARARDPERVRALTVMGAGRLRRLVWLDVFEAAPHLFAGARQASGIGLVVTVVTEMVIGARAGIGARALNAQVTYEAPEIWAAVVLTGVLGLGIAGAISGIERRVVHWKEDRP
jgi:NitT/TauT family transport system permease protein